MLRWPDADTVLAAVREWAAQTGRQRPEVLRIGCFGSYSRGDWGVGSDLDLVLIVEAVECSFERRSSVYDATSLPVPAEVLVYTTAEWGTMPPDSRFRRTLDRETTWLFSRGERWAG